MIRMHFLTPDHDANSVACNLPLKINRKRLLNMGMVVRLFLTLGKKFFDCDVAYVDCRFFSYYCKDKSVQKRFFVSLKTQKNVLTCFCGLILQMVQDHLNLTFCHM